jgi:hypothetical protein
LRKTETESVRMPPGMLARLRRAYPNAVSLIGELTPVGKRRGHRGSDLARIIAQGYKIGKGILSTGREKLKPAQPQPRRSIDSTV